MILSDAVLFFDSGVGGLAYARAFTALAPDVPIVYVADTAFFPYGERSPDQVRARVVAIFEVLLARGRPRAVVIACNTASVVALAALRERFDVPFVGVVPAVKPAAALTRTGHIAVLSTARTAADPYTEQLVKDFAALHTVTRIGLGALVEAVEAELCQEERPACARIIAESLRESLPAAVDVVVLACTHFVHVRPLFAAALRVGVQLVDSVDGVVRRTIAVAASGSGPPWGTSRSRTSEVPYLHTGVAPKLLCLAKDFRFEQLEIPR